MALSTTQVNWLNVGLMLGSCLVAFGYPFELFLFSYAVLGPLHYLTEISWLHDRKYFVADRSASRLPGAHAGWLAIVVLATVAETAALVSARVVGARLDAKWEVTLLYLVLVTALAMTVAGRRSIQVLLLGGATVLLALLSLSRYYTVVAFLVVTIGHVLVFTGAFVLYGALKGRSVSGTISLFVFLACAGSFFFVILPGQEPGEYVRQSYWSFAALNVELIRLFRLGLGTPDEVFDSQGGLVVMRLIAFAYTYHYLNWFSKTSIIRWHRVPTTRGVCMGTLWLAALAIYARDFAVGIAALHFLSLLHVLLEFPLNYLTFAGIGRELVALGVARSQSANNQVPVSSSG